MPEGDSNQSAGVVTLRVLDVKGSEVAVKMEKGVQKSFVPSHQFEFTIFEMKRATFFLLLVP